MGTVTDMKPLQNTASINIILGKCCIKSHFINGRYRNTSTYAFWALAARIHINWTSNVVLLLDTWGPQCVKLGIFMFSSMKKQYIIAHIQLALWADRKYTPVLKTPYRIDQGMEKWSVTYLARVSQHLANSQKEFVSAAVVNSLILYSYPTVTGRNNVIITSKWRDVLLT